MNDEMSEGWDSFINELRRSHIKLSEDLNDLVWEMNNIGGDYAANIDYLYLQSIGLTNIRWWW